MKVNYYTLIWKSSCSVNFKSFVTFEDLKKHVKDYFGENQIKNLMFIDYEKTIVYLKVGE